MELKISVIPHLPAPPRLAGWMRNLGLDSSFRWNDRGASFV